MAWLCFTVTMLNCGTDKPKVTSDFCDRRGQLYASWSFLLSKHWIKVLMVSLWICPCFAVHCADSLMQLLTGTLQLQKNDRFCHCQMPVASWQILVIMEFLRFLNGRIRGLMLSPGRSYSISSKELFWVITKIKYLLSLLSLREEWRKLKHVPILSGHPLTQNGMSFQVWSLYPPVIIPKNPIYANGKLKQFTSASGIRSNDQEVFH